VEIVKILLSEGGDVE